MKIKNQVKISMQSLSENIGIARMAAATFSAQAELTLGDIEEIKVAISEAVSNAVIHGYEGESGIVEFSMLLYEDRIEYIVEDFGKGIEDITAAREPSYSSDPERMGLGFVFMESFMSELEVDSSLGEGTKVKMIRRFQNALQ